MLASSLPRRALARRDTDRLLAVVQELSHLRELDDVTRVVRTAARELSGADGVTFVLREGDLVYYSDEDAIGPLWKGRRFPATACISGWCMLNRAQVVIEDIYTDPRIPLDAYRATFVKSLAMVPVRADDPVAAIGAYWATRRTPRRREVELLQAVANATAIAIRNAELFRQVELERRRAVSNAIKYGAGKPITLAATAASGSASTSSARSSRRTTARST